MIKEAIMPSTLVGPSFQLGDIQRVCLRFYTMIKEVIMPRTLVGPSFQTMAYFFVGISLKFAVKM